MSDKIEDQDRGGSEGLLLEVTSRIVSAYVEKNTVVSTDLADVIGSVNDAVINAASKAGKPVKEELVPAVPINKSVSPGFIICLEDGKKFRTLKRHLRQHFGLSPDEYREKWGLPYNYPMVAPDYAKQRSELAKKAGLGRKRK